MGKMTGNSAIVQRSIRRLHNLSHHFNMNACGSHFYTMKSLRGLHNIRNGITALLLKCVVWGHMFQHFVHLLSA